MHAVVCRFKEDLDWVKGLSIPYTIYNKGEKDINYPFIESENIGRESETFIRFIVENYEKLPNTLVFLQGNPFSHLRIFTDEIKRYQENTLISLSDTFKVDNLEGCPSECSLPIQKYIVTYLPMIQKKYFMFGTGAQYIVPKESIVNKPREWWEILHKSHYIEKRTPWILERLWMDIFNLQIN